MKNNYPALPNTIGKKGKAIVPVSNRVRRFEVIDEIKIVQSTSNKKAIYLQKIKFDTGELEFRLGYYIIGKKPKMKNKWTWGQYATMLPAKDFKKIIKEAQKKNWI